jgi:hypothetical protein
LKSKRFDLAFRPSLPVAASGLALILFNSHAARESSSFPELSCETGRADIGALPIRVRVFAIC